MIAAAGWTVPVSLVAALAYITFLWHRALLDRRGDRVSEAWLERNHRERERANR